MANDNIINFELPMGPYGTKGTNGKDGLTFGPATSITSLAIASSGSKAFTTQTNLAYAIGARVRASSASAPTQWMEGIVISYSAGILTITADKSNGAGSYADWNISVAGQPGADGAGGATGAAGSNGTGYYATSVTNVALVIGVAAVFTTQTGLAYTANMRVRCANDSTHYMEGPVTSYSGSTLTFTPDRIVGTGSFASWTIGLAGDVGAAATAYRQEYGNITFDANTILTSGTSVKIQRVNPSASLISTVSRTVTLVPTSDDNFFRIIIPSQVKVGSGLTWKITYSGGDLIVLKDGHHAPRIYDFYYTGTSYIVYESPIYSPSATTQTLTTFNNFLVFDYSFASLGGAQGNIVLGRIPNGAIIDVDNIIIENISSPTSGGSATISFGYTGSTTAFDYARPFNQYPYDTNLQTARGESYAIVNIDTNASGTLNARSGVITCTNLNAAAAGTNTATLSNSFITATSRVVISKGAYSGTLATNGVPILYSGTPTTGSLPMKIYNTHGANALSGSLTVHFHVIDEKVKQKVVRFNSATDLSMSIATADLTAGYLRLFVPYKIDEL